MTNKTYDVGYCNPPQHSRFQKGKSGNPSGRPKHSRNTYKLLEDILEQKVSIVQDGKQIKISKKVATSKQVSLSIRLILRPIRRHTTVRKVIWRKPRLQPISRN